MCKKIYSHVEYCLNHRITYFHDINVLLFLVMHNLIYICICSAYFIYKLHVSLFLKTTPL